MTRERVSKLLQKIKGYEAELVKLENATASGNVEAKYALKKAHLDAVARDTQYGRRASVWPI